MKLIVVKKRGVLKMDIFNKKNELVELKENDVLDSNDFAQNDWNRSLTSGRIQLYLKAGWLVEKEKVNSKTIENKKKTKKNK